MSIQFILVFANYYQHLQFNFCSLYYSLSFLAQPSIIITILLLIAHFLLRHSPSIIIRYVDMDDTILKTACLLVSAFLLLVITADIYPPSSSITDEGEGVVPPARNVVRHTAFAPHSTTTNSPPSSSIADEGERVPAARAAAARNVVRHTVFAPPSTTTNSPRPSSSITDEGEGVVPPARNVVRHTAFAPASTTNYSPRPSSSITDEGERVVPAARAACVRRSDEAVRVQRDPIRLKIVQPEDSTLIRQQSSGEVLSQRFDEKLFVELEDIRRGRNDRDEEGRLRPDIRGGIKVDLMISEKEDSDEIDAGGISRSILNLASEMLSKELRGEEFGIWDNEQQQRVFIPSLRFFGSLNHNGEFKSIDYTIP